MIPRTLIRTVPTVTTDEVEAFWREARAMHDRWRHVTYRDPIDHDLFPITSSAWARCSSGAQVAGLVRLEALWHHGGVYIDSDVELYRPLDSLLTLSAFAAWEDEECIPDAVLGAEPHHEAIGGCLDLALERLRSDDPDWRRGSGAWGTGPGVTTTVLADRADVLVLPPAAFYPYHYSERHRRNEDHRGPGTFGAHHWAGSWVPAGG